MKKNTDPKALSIHQPMMLKKMVLLCFLQFLICFVYSILTCIKETQLITAHDTGAEIIPIIKGSIIFPLSILVVLLYNKLSNILERSTLFYGATLFLLIIIAGYGFYLYPGQEALSPTIPTWITQEPDHKLTHFIAIYHHWIHVLFFVVSEMWGQLIMMLLYWTFVNHICDMKEAKSIYATLITGANFAHLVAGPLVAYYTKNYIHVGFLYIIQQLIGYILISGVMIMVLYWYLNRMAHVNDCSLEVSLKTTLSFWASIKHISSSRYLLNIAIMTIGCNFAMNIIDITWKSYLKVAFCTPCAYQIFTSNLSFLTGLVTLFVGLLSSKFLKTFSWRRSAQIAPLFIGALGIVFFVMSYFKHHLTPLATAFDTHVVYILALCGAFQNLFNKTIKYSFFDPTKEMAYIPLDKESKIKGKAAIDMIGSRIGKSTSSWLHIFLISQSNTASVQPFSGILAGSLAIVTFLWYNAAKQVSKKLEDLSHKK